MDTMTVTVFVYTLITNVSPSPPAVEDWRWLIDSAGEKTGVAAAAAES